MYVRHPCLDALPENVTQFLLPEGVPLHPFSGELQGAPQSHDPWHVAGTCATTSLLGSTMKQGRCFDLLSHIERSAAFGTVELMTTERQEIYAQFSDVQRELPHCLHSVGVEKDFCFLGYAPYFSNRLDGAHFVVCLHHGKQDGVRADGFPHVLRIHQAVFVDREPCDLVALLLYVPHRLETSVVFDGAADNV